MNSVEKLPKASLEIRYWEVCWNLCGIRLIRLCSPASKAEIPPEAIYFAITRNLFTLSNINSVAQYDNRRHGACVEENLVFSCTRSFRRWRISTEITLDSFLAFLLRVSFSQSAIRTKHASQIFPPKVDKKWVLLELMDKVTYFGFAGCQVVEQALN